MEVLGALLIVCGLPLALFLAGWVSCYLLVVKYRFHVERRWETGEAAVRSREVEWQA
ncbi:MAG: hypothetical protein KJ077_05935 [Anaerolineae bacterium]|nr:hypothetical protein [Anaerolineae bacterium]